MPAYTVYNSSMKGLNVVAPDEVSAAAVALRNRHVRSLKGVQDVVHRYELGKEELFDIKGDSLGEMWQAEANGVLVKRLPQITFANQRFQETGKSQWIVYP